MKTKKLEIWTSEDIAIEFEGLDFEERQKLAIKKWVCVDELKQELQEILNDVKLKVSTKIDLEKSTPKSVWDVVFSMIEDKLFEGLEGSKQK